MKIQEITSLSDNDSLISYFNRYKKIQTMMKEGEVSAKKKVNIAILASFTVKGLQEILMVKCAEIGVLANIYIGEYNQYQQELLDESSKLYQFSPDILILFVDAASLLGEAFFLPYRQTDKERRDWVAQKTEEYRNLIETFKSRSSALVLLHDLEVPHYSPLGILENKQEYGHFEAIKNLNNRLKDMCKSDSQLYLFDYDAFSAKIGKRHLVDLKMYYLGDFKLDMQYFPALCDQYLSYIKPLLQLTRKCLVLDLDDTLWGGIIGEDGIEGIKLGPTPEGRSFWEFQKYLLALFERGVILAINSKNNLADVLNVLKNHPYMVLGEEHFASMQINWDDKVTNMQSIAKEINIDLDALVFFDNDVLNREMVKKFLPQVLVVDVPIDTSKYAEVLWQLNDFNTLQLTPEDMKRGRSYAARHQAMRSAAQATNVSEYLKDLNMIVTIQSANSFSLPRLAQLTQKTNQFNMTTRRYAQDVLSRLSKSESHLIFSINVEDKFTDHGIVGVLVVEKEKMHWRIDTFLLSCRVIGRKIEDVILSFVIKLARESKASELIGEFKTTEKNAPAQDFYKSHGFELLSTLDGVQNWVYKAEKEFVTPNYIHVVIKPA
jgi:FkbH-like protein